MARVTGPWFDATVESARAELGAATHQELAAMAGATDQARVKPSPRASAVRERLARFICYWP
jgi:hypothetical protein